MTSNEEILRERAWQLAEAPVARQTQIVQEFLFFRVGTRTYALATDVVQAVSPVDDEDITFLPGAPETIVGVCNVRGRIVPVVDLALLLLGEKVESDTPRLILVEVAGLTSALMTSGIDGVRPLTRGMLQSVPASWPEEQRRHILYVTQAGEPVLQIEALLAQHSLGFEDTEAEI